jgi:hypothetical protein
MIATSLSKSQKQDVKESLQASKVDQPSKEANKLKNNPWRYG